MPPVSSKFSRKRSVGVKFADQTANVELADVLKLLENHGIPNSDIEGIQKKGKGRCEITFKTQTAFHRFCPSIAMDESVEVNTYGAGVTVVTAVGIPLELDDNFVRHRLKSYGRDSEREIRHICESGVPGIEDGDPSV
ncbi:zinc finger protein [Branchiostoma belcheri]|nr:zinc finger protein [Branchiostoma belcheri]